MDTSADTSKRELKGGEQNPQKKAKSAVSAQKLKFSKKVVLAVHGGASNVKITPEEEVAYRATMRKGLSLAYEALKNGGSAIDAVVAAVVHFEDDPILNAGIGSSLNSEGFAEMDAVIMDGKDLSVGAMAGVTNVKNPIVGARAVMDNSPHSAFSGAGAHAFAIQQQLSLAEREYFITPRKVQQWKKVQNRFVSSEPQLPPPESKELVKSAVESMDVVNVDPELLDDTIDVSLKSPLPAALNHEQTDTDDRKMGTVGCVALDSKGNLATGSSTGGLAGKLFGRIADTPMVGCGVYANNKTCAVAGTGSGEHFMKLVSAYDIHCMMAYGGKSLQEACAESMQRLIDIGGRGGVIALDSEGNLAYPYTTIKMFRGYCLEDGEIVVNVFEEDDRMET